MVLAETSSEETLSDEEAASEEEQESEEEAEEKAAEDETSEGEETASSEESDSEEASGEESEDASQTEEESKEQETSEEEETEEKKETEEKQEEEKEKTGEKEEEIEENLPLVTAAVSDQAGLLTAIEAAEDGVDCAIQLSGEITVDQTIEIQAGKKISLFTEGDSASLKRADGFNKAMFSVSGIFTLLGHEQELTLDGGQTAAEDALISMESGSQVSISENVTLRDNVADSVEGAAINNPNEDGTIVLDGGTFSGNKGKYGAVYSKSDVNLGSTALAEETISAPVKFEDNTDKEEKARGLVLDGKGTRVLVHKGLGESDITVGFGDFSGWKDDMNLISGEKAKDSIGKFKLDEGEEYSEVYRIDENGDLKRQYTLTFETNGGKAVEAVKGDENSELDLSTVKTTKEKHAFNGWYEKEDLSGDPITVYTFTGDGKVYAKWEEKETNTCTITFNSNGGSAVDPLTAEFESEIDLADEKCIPTREDCEFAGWYEKEDLSGSPVGNIYKVEEDVTLYAGWYATLKLNANGGEVSTSSIKKMTGSVVDLSSYKPTRSGYEFTGWFKSKNGSGEAVSDSYTINKNETLYAGWEKLYKLTFSTNGGSSVATITGISGTKVDLTDPSVTTTRSGYNFAGWYTSSSLSGKAEGKTFTITKDTTLYANWHKIYDVLESTITGLDGVLRFGLKITSDGKVEGGSVNFTAVGAGSQEITSPVNGDEIWVPICWNMDPNKYNNYTDASGNQVQADRRGENDNGKYTLTLNPTKAAIDSYLAAAKEDPTKLQDPQYFGSATNPKTSAAVYIYFRRKVYEEGTGWVDKNIKYIKKPLKYYMVLEKEDGTEYTDQEIDKATQGGGVDELASSSGTAGSNSDAASSAASTGSSTSQGAKTEDNTPVGPMSLLLAASFLSGVGILWKKRKTAKVKKSDEE